MTEETARRSIDWLRASGAGVLALMGGEPLLRPQFVHKVCYYAAKKGFWIYVPTNARLLRPQLTDWLADAGVATFNFAVDSVDEKPSLPKALNPVRPYFDYLIKKQYQYGYTVFFNINICRNNLEDVKQLTEIARDNGIATEFRLSGQLLPTVFTVARYLIPAQRVSARSDRGAEDSVQTDGIASLDHPWR